MKKIVFGFIILTVILIAACTKYRDVPSKTPAFVAPPPGIIAYNCLRINEFICKGYSSEAQGVLGSTVTAKWFEIYNPTTANIVLTPGQWYVTDTLGNSKNGFANGTWNKCAITTNTLTNSSYVVPANGFLVICCPKSGSGGTTPSLTHFDASFSLSSTYGHIGIYYQATPSASVTVIDTLNYNFIGGATSGASYGCFADGQGSNIAPRSAVTCESPNAN